MDTKDFMSDEFFKQFKTGKTDSEARITKQNHPQKA